MARFVVLAEDSTDAEAIHAILRKRLGRPTVQKHSAKGSARLRNKAAPWLRLAARDGYERAILLHDLDRDPRTQALNDESTLREELEAIPCPARIMRLVCIPVEELEA
jgi:hypothetical protein